MREQKASAHSKETILSVRNLKKRLKRRFVVSDVSFDVLRGEVFGFLGPNGAGKTTTIRMLVHLIRPTAGEIVIHGISLAKRPTEALKHMGCIVENPELYSYLTGWENLEHFARMLRGIDGERILEVVHIVGLEQRIHDKVKTYSLGMRQRLGIAQALLGRPKLLILDEPTNGLDPQGIKEMRQLIRALADSGISVFVSSHMLHEIQAMCDRVAIISHGKVIAVGAVNELLQQSKQQMVWQLSPVEAGRQVLASLPGVEIIDADQAKASDQENGTMMGGQQTIACYMPPGDVAAANRALVLADIEVNSIAVKQPTLEELFLQLTEGEHIE